jgi:hypothetical protein
MGGGGIALDPLVGLDDASKPLRSKLLAVPSLKQKYLQRVRAIAEKMLDWKTLGPNVAQWRALIQSDIEEDTRKLSSYDAFLKTTSDEESSEESGGREISLRSFTQKRSRFLLKNDEVSKVKPSEIVRQTRSFHSESDSSEPPSDSLNKMKISLDFSKRPGVKTPRILINELMASNTKTIADPQGDYEDWIELYNPTDSPISLDGMYLTDSDRSPRKWSIPDGTELPAKGYLLIWADEQGKVIDGLHANFKLSSKGESIYLVDRDDRENIVIDHVKFEKQTDDVSFGRHPKSQSDWLPLSPTPGRANKLSE